MLRIERGVEVGEDFRSPEESFDDESFDDKTSNGGDEMSNVAVEMSADEAEISDEVKTSDRDARPNSGVVDDDDCGQKYSKHEYSSVCLITAN
jgi:hypothetical protein